MAPHDYSSNELATQPIGYWSGETYRTVTRQIRSDLALESLTQPQWWILNHIDRSPMAWTTASLTEQLQPFDDQHADFVSAFDDLLRRAWISLDDDGRLILTTHGRQGLKRARARGQAANTQAMSGVTTAEYVNVLNVLRRIIDNLGGNSDIP